MIAIIAGCGTNITSVQCALTRLGKKSIVTTDLAIIQSASHVILPGVGTAKQTMAALQTNGLIQTIQQLQQPVLGICLGMQLLYQYSAEGNIDCLNILPEKITALKPAPNISLPHMGWNQLQIQNQQSPLFNNIANGSYVYFVHSYAAPVNEYTLAAATHGEKFSASVQRNNFYGVQFHPEKSAAVGENILQNFLTLV